MIINRNRQEFFGVILANYILIEKLFNFQWFE